PRRKGAHVRERWQRTSGGQDRLLRAGQCDRWSHDEGDILLDPVGEHRGPGLDLEHPQAGTPARIPERQGDRTLYPIVRLGEERLQIERESFEPAGDALADLVVD